MNMVENLAVFYFLYLSAAIFNPFNTAVCGLVWGVGRIIYALGYVVDPKYRGLGEFFYFSLSWLFDIHSILFYSWDPKVHTRETLRSVASFDRIICLFA